MRCLFRAIAGKGGHNKCGCLGEWERGEWIINLQIKDLDCQLCIKVAIMYFLSKFWMCQVLTSASPPLLLGLATGLTSSALLLRFSARLIRERRVTWQVKLCSKFLSCGSAWNIINKAYLDIIKIGFFDSNCNQQNHTQGTGRTLFRLLCSGYVCFIRVVARLVSNKNISFHLWNCQIHELLTWSINSQWIYFCTAQCLTSLNFRNLCFSQVGLIFTMVEMTISHLRVSEI